MSRKTLTPKFHYPDHPLVGVGVVVWREDEILLVRRKNPPMAGQWGLPGGKQQLGETIMEAAAREVREETGVLITPLSIITALDAITHDKKGKVEYHYTLIEVIADWKKGEPRADDDALDVRWVTSDEIATLCPWPAVTRVVQMSALLRAL